MNYSWIIKCCYLNQKHRINEFPRILTNKEYLCLVDEKFIFLMFIFSMSTSLSNLQEDIYLSEMWFAVEHFAKKKTLFFHIFIAMLFELSKSLPDVIAAQDQDISGRHLHKMTNIWRPW